MPETALPTAGCLDRPYPSSQKGGTVVVEDVTTLEEHERRLRSPDSYRPERCGRSGRERPHVHDRRERVLLGGVDEPGWVMILRFRCDPCHAVWRVIPAFLARNLRRSWKTVASALQGPSKAGRARVAARTRRRWRARLGSAAGLLGRGIVTLAEPKLVARVCALGFDATRRAVVDAFGGLERVAALAAWIHRLVPGVRVM